MTAAPASSACPTRRATAAQFNQVATVGMSGPFGSVNMGRQIVPMAYAMADTDVRSAQYFGSILTAWIGMNTGGGLARHQHQWADRRAVRQQRDRLSVACFRLA